MHHTRLYRYGTERFLTQKALGRHLAGIVGQPLNVTLAKLSEFKNDAERVVEHYRGLDADLIWRNVFAITVIMVRCHYLPGRRDGRDAAKVVQEDRADIARAIRSNPALAGYPETALAEVWPEARRTMAGWMAVGGARMSDECPWTAAQIIDPEFWPPPIRPCWMKPGPCPSGSSVRRAT